MTVLPEHARWRKPPRGEMPGMAADRYAGVLQAIGDAVLVRAEERAVLQRCSGNRIIRTLPVMTRFRE